MRLDDLQVRLNYVGRYRTTPSWSMGPKRTLAWSDLALWLLTDGYGVIHSKDGTFPIIPGSCLLLRGGMPYTIEPAKGVRLGHWFAHFDAIDRRGQVLKHEQMRLPPLVRQLPEPVRATALWERLIACEASDRRRAGPWLTALMQEIATQEAEAETLGDNDRTSVGLHACARRLREAPADQHRISDYAQRLGLGRDQFRRRFQILYGAGPREYLTTQRLLLAENLLTESSESIAAIAAQIGYASPFYFSRHFRRHAGCSPRAFRTLSRSQR